MQTIDGCSLELCVAILSVVSFGTALHKYVLKHHFIPEQYTVKAHPTLFRWRGGGEGGGEGEP